MLVSYITLGSFPSVVNRNATSFCTSKFLRQLDRTWPFCALPFRFMALRLLGLLAVGECVPPLQVSAAQGRFSR
jgi:hypothetical protein